MAHLPRPAAPFHPSTGDLYRFPHFPSPESLGDSTPLASSSKQPFPLPLPLPLPLPVAAMSPGDTDLFLGGKQSWWGQSGSLSVGQSAFQARTAPLGVSPASPSVSLDEHEHLPLSPRTLAIHPQISGSGSSFPGHAHPVAQAQSQWCPFGYTQLLPPASTALGRDLVPGDEVHRHPNPHESLKAELLVANDEPLQIPGGCGYSIVPTRPHAMVSSPMIPMSPPPHVCPQAIDPGLPLTEPAWDGMVMCTSAEQNQLTPPQSDSRPGSIGSAEAMHNAISIQTVAAGRRLTWSSAGDLRRCECEAEERARASKAKRKAESGIPTEREMELGMGLGLRLGLDTGLERKSDDEECLLGSTKGNKKARRQMQNRLAQRAFRARSKVQHQEVAAHLKHLDVLSKTQSDRLKKLVALADRLQRENIQLKQGR